MVAESVYCLTNACLDGSSQQIQILIELGLIETLIDILTKHNDPKLMSVCLGTLEEILRDGKKIFSQSHGTNDYFVKIVQAGGVEVIKNLQNHPNNDICLIVERLISEGFDWED